MRTGAKACVWALVLAIAFAIGASFQPAAPAPDPEDLSTVDGDPRRFGPLLGGYVLPEAFAESSPAGDRCYGHFCVVYRLTAIGGATGTTTVIIKNGNLWLQDPTNPSIYMNSLGTKRLFWNGTSFEFNDTLTVTSIQGGAAGAATSLPIIGSPYVSAGKALYLNGATQSIGVTFSSPNISLFGAPTLSDSAVTATTFVRTIGVATGSLPACIGGEIETDSTLNTLTYCSAGTRKTLQTVGAVSSPWSVYCEKSPCTKAETAADAFLMPAIGLPTVTPSRIACNWRTAGVGGSTGAVFAIWNATDSSELCNCAIPCTGASGVVASCTPSCAAFTSGKSYVVRLKSTTDCGTIPGLIGCTVTLGQ